MANDEKFRIIFTGGGSGGHVYPLLAVYEALAKKLVELKAPAEFIYMGPNDAYGVLFKNRNMTVKYIVSGKLRRYFSLQNIIDVPKFFIGLVQSFWKMYFIMPDIIFSKGGTGSLAVVTAAWFYRIPIVIHESDAQPGLNNLLSARFAKRIFVSFSAAAAYFNPNITEVSGAPLRKELLEGRTTKPLAKETLGFDPAQLLTLVLGGSQGSTRINEFVFANLPEFMKETQVFHQTGVANLSDAQKLSRAALIDQSVLNRYQAAGYLENNMALALTAADLVVTRSGSSVFELAAFGDPAILIPLAESANDHQRADAAEFEKTGGAVMIEEENLLPGIFFGQLHAILSNDDLRAKMSVASVKFFIPGAPEKIAEAIISLVATE